MKNANAWRPSKYVYRYGRLVASRDRAEVNVGSRLVTDLIARAYAAELPKHARGRLLDLGCGKVPLYLAYKSLVSDNTCVPSAAPPRSLPTSWARTSCRYPSWAIRSPGSRNGSPMPS